PSPPPTTAHSPPHQTRGPRAKCRPGKHHPPPPTRKRGRGRGPEASNQHGTSYGPDNSRPLPNPLPRWEREMLQSLLDTEVAISTPTPLGVIPRLFQLRHQHIGKSSLNLNHATFHRAASPTALFQLLTQHFQLRGLQKIGRAH